MADRYSMRSQTTPPHALIEGWPMDYLADYAHPTLHAQQMAAQVEPFRRLDVWMDGQAVELPGFVVYGPPGYYKTGLALACLLKMARAGYFCRFVTAERLAAERESTAYSKRDGTTSLQLLDELLFPEILVIDDMATREYSGPVRAMFFDTIRERHSRRSLTILTTNISLNTKEGRMQFSRSIDGRVLSTFTGQGFHAANWTAASLRALAVRTPELQPNSPSTTEVK